VFRVDVVKWCLGGAIAIVVRVLPSTGAHFPYIGRRGLNPEVVLGAGLNGLSCHVLADAVVIVAVKAGGGGEAGEEGEEGEVRDSRKVAGQLRRSHA
jgi:hypothetical protein